MQANIQRLVGTLLILVGVLGGCAAIERQEAADTEAAAAAAALPPALERRFTALDANGDGFIEEREVWADAEVDRRFELGDINFDGKLDRAEFEELVDSDSTSRRAELRK
jgi:hypothetical protein